MKAIDVKDISKVYMNRRKAHTAVDQLSFSVERGSIFGLLGPNGAGKTSIIKMMCGLLTPTTGDIHIYGQSITKKEQAARRQIGALLEGKRSLYWPMTVRENLLYFGRVRQMGRKVLNDRISELLEQMNLHIYEKQTVGKLSTGNQQKLALAVAIIHQPKLLLLDEPTLGLDIHAANDLKELIKQYVQSGENTIFLTTHDMNLAEEVCHEFLILREGKINQQFKKEIFQTYAQSITFSLSLQIAEHLTDEFHMQFESEFPYRKGIIHAEISLDKLTVTLQNPSDLSVVIQWLVDKEIEIIDIDKEVLKLEDVFLDVDHHLHTEKVRRSVYGV